MSTSRFIYVLFVLFAIRGGAQVDFSDISLKAAIQLASQENKIIFVDVYTDWCGPCKLMTKTTFQDKDLGVFMNHNYINLKLDAEAEQNANLVADYDIVAYPSLLYLDKTGYLIKKHVGFMTAQELHNYSTRLLTVLNDTSLIAKSNRIDPESLAEITEILRQSEGVSFPGKKKVFEQLLNIIQEDEELFEKHLDLIIDNLSPSDSIALLSQVISALPASDEVNFKAMKHHFDRIKILGRLLHQKMKQGDQNGNLKAFRQAAYLNMKLNSKSTLFPKVDREKRYHRSILKFYKDHSYKQEYASLADSLIKEYILIHSVEQVKQRDEIWVKFTENYDNLSSRINVEMEIPKKDSLSINEILDKTRHHSLNISSRLNEIAEVFAEFFEDEAHLIKAKEWSELSIKYLPMPEYYTSLVKLHLMLNNSTEALLTIDEGLKSEYITEESKNALLELRRNILPQELKE